MDLGKIGGWVAKYVHAGHHWGCVYEARQTSGERSMSAEALYEAMGLEGYEVGGT